MGTINDDLHVGGHLGANSMTLAANSVNNATVQASAGISASKLEHQHRQIFEQPNTAATSETRVIHVARGAGTIIKFSAGSIAIAAGAATVTVNLLKNGVSILSGAITLDTGNVAYTPENGTVSNTAVAAGDVFTVTTVATAGGGTLPTGVFASLDLSEAYAA